MSDEQKPYACPECGSTDDWVAEYDEPVYQSVFLPVADDGTPDFVNVEYTGVTGSYDISGDDTGYRCQSCDYIEDVPDEKEKALSIVCEAAGNWANEIAEYILPAEPGPEYNWQERIDAIEAALAVLQSPASGSSSQPSQQ